MGDHRQQLEMQTAELEHLCTNINITRSRLEGLYHVMIMYAVLYTLCVCVCVCVFRGGC